ncbi:MAG: HAMP domain-containing protein [Spirochaetaceae bacterium]|nr:MAG: HAMP domain-containing protein [Spirochaetaceae bacterium]
MNVRKKIALAFLLLTFLTLATGCIGLLFIYRVLAAFGAVSRGADSPSSDLAGLNRQVHRAVLISQELSYDKEIDDILQLRQDFTRTVQEFDRSFNRIRRGIEDEMYLGTLERFKEEQNELKEQTHGLINAIIEELRAENTYRQSLAASDRDWFQLVSGLEQATETLIGDNPLGSIAGRSFTADQQVSRVSLLSSLAVFQQLLLEIRLRLKEYLSIEEPQQLGIAEMEIEILHEQITEATAAFNTSPLGQTSQTYRSWAAGVFGETGLLKLYSDGLALKIRTDAMIETMRSEMGDTLHTLDTVVALSSRFAVGGSDRGFVTAAPTLLVIAIAIATVLSVALSIVVTHAITRPVRQLIAVTDAVREGDYSRRLKITSRDELASLGAAFNRMVEEINRSQREIRSLNADLERRVRERTADLEEEIRQRERAEHEMRQKQEQLIHAGKLASLGVLVAGVAHEINNPNQAVMMGAQLLQKTWPDVQTILDDYFEREGDFLLGGINYSELGKDIREHYSGIVESARRIDSIVQGLKDFAKQDRADMAQIVNLNLIVKSSLILLDSMLKKATDRLTVELSPRIPAIHGNAQRLEQVVVNLVQNACQALAERSQEISISTDYDERRNRVVLEVRDQGEGIPRENLAKICDPFFTTKREEGGTGLGLSVTSTIIKDHRGELEFHSDRGKGTTVRVFFPVDAERKT